MSESSPKPMMQVDPDLVRQLAELLDTTNLTEIEVEDGERRIRVVRKPASVQATHYAPPPAAPPAAPAPAAQPEPAADDPRTHAGAVRSPMVGTAYLSAEPGAAPFVSEGATVREGDTLLIVEAMKVMNPITAPRGGRITRILVANQQPVEYDQPLVIIE